MGTEAEDKSGRRLMISIHSKYQVIQISKEVIRKLGSPHYICPKVNKSRTSVAIMPCKEKDVMSFAVPENLLTDNSVGFRLCSKQFVELLIYKNNLDIDITYQIDGTYLAKNNAVIFNMEDAKEFVHKEDDEEF